jgi:hypothetical protein
LETKFSQMMPARQFVKFNIDAMIRTDLLSRYQAHEIAIRSGWRNPDEIRALEDLPPIPGGGGQAFKPIATVPETSAEPRAIPGKEFEPTNVGGQNGQADPTGKQGVNGVRH